MPRSRSGSYPIYASPVLTLRLMPLDPLASFATAAPACRGNASRSAASWDANVVSGLSSNDASVALPCLLSERVDGPTHAEATASLTTFLSAA